MDKNEVIKIVLAYKNLLKQHFKFESIYLFGSYANDTFTPHSDIDVAIIVDKVKGDFFSINPLLWKIRREIDDRIEPILIEKEFDDSGFYKEIQKSGIPID